MSCRTRKEVVLGMIIYEEVQVQVSFVGPGWLVPVEEECRKKVVLRCILVGGRCTVCTRWHALYSASIAED